MAESILHALHLEKMLFIPCHLPPHKPDREVTGAHHRFAMVDLATGGIPGLEVSDVEIKRGGISYTVDTLRELRRQYGSQVRLVFLLGADSVASLPFWNDAATLFELCEFVVLPRALEKPPDFSQVERKLGSEITSRLRNATLTLDTIEISSTEIRDRVRAGLPLTDYVPKAVEQYVLRNGLYRPGSPLAGTADG